MREPSPTATSLSPERLTTTLLATIALAVLITSLPAPASAQARQSEQTEFRGRPIAEVMSYLGAEWLVRDTRVQEEQPDRMLDTLQIEPGMIVADVGAGVGFHSLKLAQRVGPTGLVYATDVQPQMLRMLIQRAEQAGIDRVVPVLCTQTYTGLPPEGVDLILMVDVYHEMSDPEAAVAGLRQALKPGGRLVLVEFRGEDPTVPIKHDHKMTVTQVRKELEPLGFEFVRLDDFLPWQHILQFRKPLQEGAEAEPPSTRTRDERP